MNIDLTRFKDELDKPGTGIEAIRAVKGPNLGDQADTSDVTTDEEASADASSAAQNADVLSDEEKVPKSRFRKTRDELIELRHKDELRDEQFRRLEAELENVRSSSRVSSSNGDMPAWWSERWGDSEQSKASWETYNHTMKEELRSLREDLKNEDRAERQARQEREQAVSAAFDDQLETLEDSLGKSLSDKQAAELLGIVEEYSPTDDEGNFESFISLDKAYEIFDLRQRGSRGTSKDRLSRIAATTSQGDATAAPSANPPQWGDWRRRIGG